MAEIAVGVVAAEQVVSTAVEGGAAAATYGIAKPTAPLKATFARLGSVPQTETPDSLARSHHSLTCVEDNVYIYGGLVGPSVLAGPEVHILKLYNTSNQHDPQYKSIPALGENETDPPKPRAGHAAVNIDGKVIMYGGFDNPRAKEPLDEGGKVWSFDPESMHWTGMEPVETESIPRPGRYEHAAAAWKATLIVHGGFEGGQSSSPVSSTWQFILSTKTWKALPALPEGSESSYAPPNMAVANDRLWVLTAGKDKLSNCVHVLDLTSVEAPITPGSPADGEKSSPPEAPTWTTIEIPTNPLTPGPSPRYAATFLPISTGQGRIYLLLAMGAAHPEPESPVASPTTASKTDKPSQPAPSPHGPLSDLWTLQLPPPASTAASAKDAAREKLKVPTHALSWSTIDVQPLDLTSPNPLAISSPSAARDWLENAASDVGDWARGAGQWVRGRVREAGASLSEMHLAGVEEGVPTVAKNDVVSPPAPAHVAPGSKGPASAPASDYKHENDLPADNTPGDNTAASPTAKPAPAHLSPTSSNNTTEHAAPSSPPSSSSAAAPPKSAKKQPEPVITSGKAQPGPRAYVAAAVTTATDPARVVLWGGVNASGECEGDGWVVRFGI